METVAGENVLVVATTAADAEPKQSYHAVVWRCQGATNGIYRAEGGRARRQPYRANICPELRSRRIKTEEGER